LDRGWYAAPIGWVGDNTAELAVAIRSALIRGRQGDLFVGAGVVAGSTCEGEWLGTGAKSLTLLQALGGCGGDRQPGPTGGAGVARGAGRRRFERRGNLPGFEVGLDRLGVCRAARSGLLDSPRREKRRFLRARHGQGGGCASSGDRNVGNRRGQFVSGHRRS